MSRNQTAVDSGFAHLTAQIAWNQEVAQAVAESSSEHQKVLAAVQTWQRARLDGTYSDLRQAERYQAACEFFLDELYGGRNVAERDKQLDRAAPIMKRFLPDHLLGAVGDALRLQAMSLLFDYELAGHLIECRQIDQEVYSEAYRAQGDWAGRRDQLRLIHELGYLLGETVRHPMIHRLIRLMRTPAKVAGVGLLQRFLQEGLDAFAVMGVPDHFLETIRDREQEALVAMESGQTQPFGRWIGNGPEPIKVARSTES